jgi:hypothetical protein
MGYCLGQQGLEFRLFWFVSAQIAAGRRPRIRNPPPCSKLCPDRRITVWAHCRSGCHGREALSFSRLVPFLSTASTTAPSTTGLRPTRRALASYGSSSLPLGKRERVCAFRANRRMRSGHNRCSWSSHLATCTWSVPIADLISGGFDTSSSSSHRWPLIIHSQLFRLASFGQRSTSSEPSPASILVLFEALQPTSSFSSRMSSPTIPDANGSNSRDSVVPRTTDRKSVV